MNRQYIIDFINNDILPQVKYDWKNMFVSARDLVKLVTDFRRKQIAAGTAKKDDILTAQVIDGYLYINNIPIDRIAPKDPRPIFNEYSYYIEGRILARQESYDN